MLLQSSMNHVIRARVLIEQGDETHIRYAALELRMAIESGFYRLLPVYKEELPDDIVKSWQPKKLLDAIIDCNPDAEHDYTITYAPEGTSDVPLTGKVLGHHKAVSKELLRKYYHRLGSLLHAPMDEQPLDLAKAKVLLTAAATRMEQHCSQTTLFANIAEFYSVVCVCGRLIKRNSRAVEKNPIIRCPDANCGAVFDLASAPGESTEWKLRQIEFNCPDCESPNYFGIHLIDTGRHFTCIGCNRRYQITTNLVVADFKPPKPNGHPNA